MILEESFRVFQGRIAEEYERIVGELALVVIDTSSPIERGNKPGSDRLPLTH